MKKISPFNRTVIDKLVLSVNRIQKLSIFSLSFVNELS